MNHLLNEKLLLAFKAFTHVAVLSIKPCCHILFVHWLGRCSIAFWSNYNGNNQGNQDQDVIILKISYINACVNSMWQLGLKWTFAYRIENQSHSREKSLACVWGWILLLPHSSIQSLCKTWSRKCLLISSIFLIEKLKVIDLLIK